MPGQSRQLPINVRNSGFLTATARIEMQAHPAFKLLGGTQVGAAAVRPSAQLPALWLFAESDTAQNGFAHTSHVVTFLASLMQVIACPHNTSWHAAQVFTVESKKAANFTVEFTPQELGTFGHELQLGVNNNPFEQYKVALTGQCVRWYSSH
jgi:hypothetical protein